MVTRTRLQGARTDVAHILATLAWQRMQTFYQIHSTDVTIGDCGGAHVLGVTTTDALCRVKVGAWKLVELFRMRFAL